MKTILSILFVLVCLNTLAQNNDSLFSAIKQTAYKGEYKSALFQLETLISKNPTNGDYLKLKASIFSWSQEQDSAINTIQKIKNLNTDIEAQNMLSTFLFRNKNYEQAILNTEKTLAIDANQIEATTVKLDALFALKNYATCYHLSKNLQKVNPKLKNIYFQSANKYFDKRITTGFTKTISNNSSFDLINLQYQQSIKKSTLISSIHFLNRNQQQAFQFQQEAYQAWKKFGYSYASASYSSSNLFPKFSAALVHFFPLAKNIETDLGFRYYLGANKTKSYVPSLGMAYSIKNITFQYRYYKIIGESSNGNSHAFMIKRTLKLPEQYIKLDFGIGTQYDLTTRAYTDLTNIRKGQNIQLSISQPIHPKLKLITGAMFTNDVLNEKNTTKQLTFNVSLTYKFSTK